MTPTLVSGLLHTRAVPAGSPPRPGQAGGKPLPGPHVAPWLEVHQCGETKLVRQITRTSTLEYVHL